MVDIKILGSATEKVGARELNIRCESPRPICELLPGKPLNPDLYIVLINGKSQTLDSVVRDEDKIVIMPKISGG